MSEKLLYQGLKVKLQNPDILVGTLRDVYEELGYLYINKIYDNESVALSETTGNGTMISLSVDNIIPVYDGDILDVLYRKEREYKALGEEIENIKTFINNTCKNV